MTADDIEWDFYPRGGSEERSDETPNALRYAPAEYPALEVVAKPKPSRRQFSAQHQVTDRYSAL